MTDRSVTDDDNGGAVGFLQRWSRRKVRGEEAGDVQEEVSPAAPVAEDAPAATGEAAEDDGDARIDPRTGKRFDELTDDDMPKPSELSADSDVSAFFAKGVSQAVRLAALRTLWHSAKFNKVDLMAEYSGDFTNYEKLGNVVTHDMHRAVKREMDRARERQEALEASAREDAESRQAGVERHEATSNDDAASDDVGQNDPEMARHSVSNGPVEAGDSRPTPGSEDAEDTHGDESQVPSQGSRRGV